jgi:hypothetical protein
MNVDSLLIASERYGPCVANMLPDDIVSMLMRNGQFTRDIRPEKAHFGPLGVLSSA